MFSSFAVEQVAHYRLYTPGLAPVLFRLIAFRIRLVVARRLFFGVQGVHRLVDTISDNVRYLSHYVIDASHQQLTL